MPQPGASAGWWADHPSAGLEPGMRPSRISDTPPGRWIGLSKRQAAVGDDRAGRSACPSRYQVRGHRARAWTPCSSSFARLANRVGALYVRIALPPRWIATSPEL